MEEKDRRPCGAAVYFLVLGEMKLSQFATNGVADSLITIYHAWQSSLFQL